MYVINYFPFEFDYYFPFGYKYFPFGFDYFPFGFDYFPRLSRKSRFELNKTIERVCDYINSIPDLDSVLNDDD